MTTPALPNLSKRISSPPPKSIARESLPAPAGSEVLKRGAWPRQWRARQRSLWPGPEAGANNRRLQAVMTKKSWQARCNAAPTGTSSMIRFSRLALVAIGLVCTCLAGHPALATSLAELYQSQTIVNGQGEEHRQAGFKICLDKVLVRVSGDQRLPAKPQMTALRDKAGSFVSSFRYRDRMEGIPNHDDQGTYDRPHDLTCQYTPPVIDKVLAELGSKPWLGERPIISVLLAVQDARQHFVLASDGDERPYMAESFQSAAGPLAMKIVIPSKAALVKTGAIFEQVRALSPELLARTVGNQELLAGSLVWSDKELGWIADWRLAMAGKTYKWQVRGVNFDEAFRVAMRGAAQILSGNGQPE
ncbi:DUF2066 domain-containing protein [Mesorhizobium sp. M0815]|uniref:DUF2066 domain-containing protein n=1 Tax=Mesorhizobium sp. M0815 TaxID=2957005 RepID=UPI00333C7141